MTPIPSALPPSPDALRTFFRQQRTLPVQAAAALLGWTPEEVKRRAVEDETLVRGNLVPWRPVAAWLFEAWSYQWVIETLGPDATTLPAGLQATPVLWFAPLYLVHALNVQRQLEPLPHRTVRPLDLSDYLTDLLHRGIDPTTVAALRSDRAFMDSYAFPEGANDD